MVQKSSKISGFLYRNFHMFFIFAYVMLLCQAMVSCYRVKDFSYPYIFILFITGILLYKLYSIITAKALVRPAAFFFALSALVLMFSLKHLLPFWDIYIIQNLDSINHGIYNESEIYFHQFLPFLIVLVPVITAAAFVLSSKGRSEPSILLFSLFMFSFWNNGLDKLLAAYVPRYIMLSLLFYSFCRYREITCICEKTDIKVNVNFNKILLYILIAAFSITFLVSATIRLFGSKSIVQLRNDYAINEARLVNGSRKSVFDLSNTGYGSHDGRLGGPIQLDPLISLRVKADRPAYLRGSVKDYYDGHSWSTSVNNYSMPGIEALTATTPSFNLSMTGSTGNRPGIVKMSIYHYGLATSTLFSPGNTIGISAKNGKVMYDLFHTFMLMGKETVSEPYTVKYYISSTGIENFKTAKDSGLRISYESGSEAVTAGYEAYLQVPESISPRTKRLLQELIRGCRTTDEKVERIMDYLSGSYPYSLNVSQVPEDTDFIDYFLFSEKKGYCTYFASAATIMFRLAGIPARYVEGFNMDDEMDASGLYIVRNYRAHAWTEILVSPESSLWCIADCVPQGAQISDISISGQYIDKFADDRYKALDGRFSDIPGDNSDNDGLGYYASLLSLPFYPLLIITAAIIVFIALYILYCILIFKRRNGRLLKQQSSIPLYRQLVSRLKSMGEAFPEESCELEYVKGMQDKELSKLLEKLVEACYSEYYGGFSSLSLIDRRSCNRKIERYLRKKFGFFRYWHCIIRNYNEAKDVPRRL